MRYLALFSLVLGVSVAARADIPPSYDFEQCEQLRVQQRQLQRTLFDSPEHEALRDLTAYQTWFATTRELDLMQTAPGMAVPPRMGVLLQRLDDVKARLHQEAAAQAVMRHPVCAQVTDLEAQVRRAGCFYLQRLNFWEDVSACLSTPAILNPPISALPVAPPQHPAL